MKNLGFKLTIILLMVTISYPLWSQQITIDTMMKHLTVLASPEFEGRLSGTAGYDKAKDYTVNLFKNYGLKPYRGNYVQELFVEANVIKHAIFEQIQKHKKITYQIGQDYACRGFSGSGDVTAQAVFCGYGIVSDNYNDYKDVDVKNKIVVVLKGNPSFLPDSITSSFVYARDKARAAQIRGAKAIVIITMPGGKDTAEVQGSVLCGNPPHLIDFPMIQPNYNCGKKLLETEIPLSDLITKINKTKQPQSFVMKQKIHINVQADYTPNAKTYNIVGQIEGSDSKLKNEYIVFGAHLDHVGMQTKACLFPGADDNASGTVTVLEVARIMNQLKERPKRTIVFVLFASEESGLHGASHFVKQLQNPKDIVAFINADCVGNGDSIHVLGGIKYPELYQIILNKNKIYTQFITTEPTGNPGADATPFMEVGIPCAYFKNKNGYHHLHLPSDTPETINRIMLEKQGILCLELLRELGRGSYHGEKK